MAEAIKVAVRVRPFNQREKDLKSQLCVSMSGANTTVTSSPPKTFTFDFSYWSHTDKSDPAFADQDKVMKDIGEVILKNALNGFNGCLFAYGQTGSGKSYSVMGYGDAPGIIPRSVDKIFEEKRKLETDAQKELRVWIAYVEIYNEHIRDLLHAGENPTELKIQDHPKLGTYIPDLTEAACKNPEDVQKLMDFGTKKRVTAATQMNATSSRSHAVFTVKCQFLEGAKPAPDAKDERKSLSAKINLVDLAGSERSSKTGAEGATLKEGCAINQSLSALGLVIKELSEAHSKKGGKDAVVPFRSSKLTFLLKDSLAGNSKTYMVAAISPASDNMDETVSTLRFASSVKKIKTVATQNKDKKDEMIEALQEEIKKLKESGLHVEEGGGASMAVEEREKLVEEMKKSFEDQIKKSEEMEEQRADALADGGLSGDEINQAFGVDAKTPYLLNMADDPMLAGCLLYFVAEGKPTTIGSQKEMTITLKGIGIPDQLCKLENVGNTNITISKMGAAGRVVVNGKLLSEGTTLRLNHNDKIFLGRAYALKLTMPASVPAHSEEEESLSLEGLEDEWCALEDSPSWSGLQMYLDQVLRQMPADQAKSLFEDVKEGCKLCDEANDITAECRGDDCLHFEVDLTSSVPSSVVVRVLHSTEGPDGDAASWQPLYLWPVLSMRERLERMRDAHECFVRKGFSDVDVLVDPWHETAAADITARVTELEIACEDLRNEVSKLKNDKQTHLGRSLMMWNNDKAEQQRGVCFRAWANHVIALKQSKRAPARRSLTMSSRGKPDTKAGTAAGSRTATPAKSKPGTSASTTTAPSAKAKTSPAKNGSERTPSKGTTAPLTTREAPPPRTREPVGQQFETEVIQSEVIEEFQEVTRAMPEPEFDSPAAPEWAGPPSKIQRPAPAPVPAEAPLPTLNGGSTQMAMQRAMGEVSLAPRAFTGADMSSSVEEAASIEEMAVETRAIRGENDALRKQLEAAWQLCSVLRSRIQDQEEVRQLRNECNRLRKDHANFVGSTGVTGVSSPRLVSDSRVLETSNGLTEPRSPGAARRSPSAGDLARARSQSPLVPRQGMIYSASSAAVVGLQPGPFVFQQPSSLRPLPVQGPVSTMQNSYAASPSGTTTGSLPTYRFVSSSTTPVKGATYLATPSVGRSLTYDRPFTARG